ncbi:MAG TPA: hypothetical protein VLL25_18535 [Acidimicrobiales bacterium]|nr:hypothetical protein [Acidimicrobiales bacterium]
MTPTVPEPLTLLAEGVAQVHELFLAYLKAGFNESQALYLVAAVMTAQMRPLPPQP